MHKPSHSETSAAEYLYSIIWRTLLSLNSRVNREVPTHTAHTQTIVLARLPGLEQSINDAQVPVKSVAAHYGYSRKKVAVALKLPKAMLFFSNAVGSPCTNA